MKRYYYEGKLLSSPSNVSTLQSRTALEEACEKGTVLEGVCEMCDKEHNLHINLGVMKGIIERNEGALGIDSGQMKDIALISKVGKPVQFIITSFEKNENGDTFALLSRKAVQEKCAEQYIKELACGDIVEAKITHLERFGAFVDIGAGINSLIPIDMLSVSRISYPSQRVREGEVVRAVVKNKDNSKITLSMRELLGTWEENAAKFNVGETVRGIVRSVESYGVFIELTPNLAGLAEYNPDLRAGQAVSVYIKTIIKEKMKIKLSVIDSFSENTAHEPLRYFINSEHIDYWRYSPEECEKLIESVFE